MYLFENIYIAGNLLVVYLCNDAFLPLEDAVSPSRGEHHLLDCAGVSLQWNIYCM